MNMISALLMILDDKLLYIPIPYVGSVALRRAVSIDTNRNLLLLYPYPVHRFLHF